MTRAIDTSKVYKCSRCHDTHWILKYIPANQATSFDGVKVYPDDTFLLPYASRCPYCDGDERKKALFKNSYIPFQYSTGQNKFDWNAYGFIDVSKKKTAVQNFVDNFAEVSKNGIGLYLWSEKNGTGKTSLACLIGNELLNRSVEVKFLPCVEILDAASSGTLDEYERCDLLILDDIGKKKTGADYYDETLLKLIDKRYGRKTSTIFTSNISLEDIEIDPAIFSRVKSRVLSIQMPELSIRESEDEAAKEVLLRLGE